MATRMPPGVFLSDEEAAELDFVLRRAVAVLAARDGMVPGVLVRFSEDVHKVADGFRASVLVNPDFRTTDDAAGSAAGVFGVSERLSAAEAARLTGVSTRFITEMARRGVLQGMRSGHRGAWTLDGNSVACWAAERHRTKAA